ncbi:MAG TPA: hypothetical protein VFE62_01460 [Gemmataceae bacterium]|nr:hypothetical protein [Pirellulales bacterium]HZZ77153.1 hypothetical protein [Gemmataceae bacterium]
MASEFGKLRPVSELLDDCRRDEAKVRQQFEELAKHQRRYGVECGAWARFLEDADKLRRYALGCLEHCADANVVREAEDPMSPLFKGGKLDDVERIGRRAYARYKVALMTAEAQNVKELVAVSFTAEPAGR